MWVVVSNASQSYPSLFTLSIIRFLCDFDYVSGEKLAQVISAVQELFLKLFNTTWWKDSFSSNWIIEVHIVNIIKGSKLNWCSSHKLLHYAELIQLSLKEDLVSNGYSLFAEEVISKPQYAEEFIKSFKFSLLTTFSRFWVSQEMESLCEKKRAVG